MKAYYNEIEPSAILWLKAAMEAGHIMNGDVDSRPIQEVKANDLHGYTQHHFFAGIGGWSIALRLAGWPDEAPVWTGSCPCQPFSTAGNQKGQKDDRHLWPHWFSLIRQCTPATIFGEQVAGAIAFGWLDSVQNDLEAESYAVAASVLPACGVGAPHKRDRLWFVADSQSSGMERTANDGRSSAGNRQGRSTELNLPSNVGDSQHNGQFAATKLHRNEASSSERRQEGSNFSRQFERAGRSSDVCSLHRGVNREWENTCDMADAERLRQQGQGELRQSFSATQDSDGKTNRANYFSEICWIDCPDGKQRPVESSLCLLADGIPHKLRKAVLHGFGNAIVPQVAAEFIGAYMEVKR